MTKCLNSARDLERILCRHHWIKLGEGYYSSVFHKTGKDTVIKLNNWPDAGFDYYRWAMEHQNIYSWVPRISALHEYPDGTYACAMEYLPDAWNIRGDWRPWESEAYRIIMKAFPEYGMDTGGHNTRMRGSQPVFTDPLGSRRNSVHANSYQRYRLPCRPMLQGELNL